jgi:ribonuclease E
MLIDATHPEETRVAVVDGTRLEEFDFEMAARRQIKSNIYLAKVTRVEPSLQAAFVEYGGNRHGFLPFPEIHPDYYRIPVGDRMSFDEPEERPARRRRPSRANSEISHDSETPNGEASVAEHVETEATAPEELPAAETEAETDAEAWTEDTQPSDADELPATIAELSAPDPTIAEAAVYDDEGGHIEDAGESAEIFQPTATGEEGGAHAEPVEEALTVDVVGGDEVEDAQRRRRFQMQHYKIQEVIKRRQIMLVQVSKEERGNKGAAVTTFLSLPGRYCVLMPNTSRGGGVSRKIANPADRKRMKELISDLEVPEGMSVILRTAGVERSKAEIKRDLEYLLRLWENIRTLTLESTAPALIYEEGNLVKRAIRDLYTRDIDSIEIAGEEGYRQAKDFMRMLMPSHAKRVQPYRDPSIPLFFRYQVETQIDLIHNPVAHLKSGGYIVINQTEALVSIDVNSGRSTRERNIEETALKTNLEAADEIARQLRLRDMGGLIVIDFIDMDEPRHDGQVERRLKEAMKNDRARIQVGRISPFGLLELSRQRLHPSLIETNFHTCAHCLGTGLVRSIESASLLVLRAIEEEGIKHRSAEISVTVATNIALYVLNQKRGTLNEIEQRYGFQVRVMADDSLIAPEHRIDRIRAKPPGTEPPALNLTATMAAHEAEIDEADEIEDAQDEEVASEDRGPRASEAGGDGEPRRRRRRNRRRRGRDRDGRPEGEQDHQDQPPLAAESAEDGVDSEEEGEAPAVEHEAPIEDAAVESGEDGARRRRRGRRGGRGRPRRGEDEAMETASAEDAGDGEPVAELPTAEPQAEAPDFEPQLEAAPVPEPVEAVVPTEPEPAPSPAAPEPQPEPPAPPVARDYETVNQPPEQPKRGFWKRLVQ